jgi:urea transporter
VTAPPALTALPGLLRQCLAQVAQIYFERSALAGLVIVAALAVVQPWAAVGMGWASLVALVTSRIAGLDRGDRESGLYGYNAALTGAGLLSMFAPDPRVFVYLTMVSILSTLISARWLRWGKLPPLTSLFVLAMWGALALGERLGASIGLLGCADGVATIPCGIGQVTFIAGALPGLCVWAALTWFAPRAGLWLGIGAALGGGGGLLWAPALAIGLAVNVGLTMQGLTVFDRGVLIRALGGSLAAGLCLAGAWLGLAYFTAPFIVATWALLLATRVARVDRGGAVPTAD